VTDYLRGGLGRLETWLGKPVGPTARWAATEEVELGRTTYPINRGRVEREGREGSEGQSHKRKRGKEGVKRGRGPRGP